MYFFLSGTSTNSKGVAILIVPNFEYKIVEFVPDKEGRFIILTIEIDSKLTLTLVNLYGPNSDDPEWFLNLFNRTE